MIIKKRIRVLWISIVCFIGVIVFFYSMYPLRPLTLTMVRWQSPPTVAAVINTVRKGEKGLLLLRLKDGKEQFVIGSWNVNFAPSGNSFVYESFPLFVTPPENQTLYAMEGAERISIVKMTNMKGAIVSVQENPAHTYLFIETKGDKVTTYCIVRKLSDGKPVCQEINIRGTVASGLWNPHKERELVIKTEGGEIYAHDPWEKKPEKIDVSADAARYRTLDGLFRNTGQPTPTTMVYNGVPYRFWKVGPVLFVHGAEWSIHRVPLFSNLSWLVDATHLLVQEKDSLSIMDLSLHGKALLLLEPGVGKKKIQAPVTQGAITMQ